MRHAAIISHERRALLADRARLLLLVVFLLLCLFALAGGAVHKTALTWSTRAFVAEKEQALDKWRARASAVESGSVKPEADPADWRFATSYASARASKIRELER